MCRLSVIAMLALALSSCSFFGFPPNITLAASSTSPLPGTTVAVVALESGGPTSGLSYAWAVDKVLQDCSEQQFDFTPPVDGSYEISCLIGYKDHIIIKSLTVASPSPATLPYAETKRLLGTWAFMFSVFDSFGFNYLFDHLVDDTNQSGEWKALGKNEGGTSIIGSYRPISADWSILDPQSPQTSVMYVFTFLPDFTVSGQAFVIDQSTTPATWSMGYFANGMKVPLARGPSGPLQGVDRLGRIEPPSNLVERYKSATAFLKMQK